MTIDSQFRAQLRREGFDRVYLWEDAPNTYYPDHTHVGWTVHVILSGEMTLTMRGESRTFREGQRVDVPGGAVHSAKIGPTGCRYLVGEK